MKWSPLTPQERKKQAPLKHSPFFFLCVAEDDQSIPRVRESKAWRWDGCGFSWSPWAYKGHGGNQHRLPWVPLPHGQSTASTQTRGKSPRVDVPSSAFPGLLRCRVTLSHQPPQKRLTVCRNKAEKGEKKGEGPY